MNILQVSSLDTIGGAARIAWTLHNGFRARGHNSWMAVGQKLSEDRFVCSMAATPPQKPAKFIFQLGQWVTQRASSSFEKKCGNFLQRISRTPGYFLNRLKGFEDFDYPETRNLLNLPGDFPEIAHLHNLHGNYFDLRYLPVLTKKRPTILTLHDTWLLSGHCAYSLDCERWKHGCGNCPYLNINPPVKRDSTAYNWRRKQEIYQNSWFSLVSPSEWLLDKVNHSMLSVAVKKSRVIHNGIDLSIFRPANKIQARSRLKLPPDAFICLFVAAGTRDNMFKDYGTIYKAIELVSQRWQGRKIIFIALGGEQESSHIGETEIILAPFISSPEDVACYYQSADVYLHAARADTFPNVILEALACGAPVIATGVGGIPEQVIPGKTGFITPPADADAMAEKIVSLFQDDELRSELSFNAADDAKRRFGLDRMVDAYLAFYAEVIQDWNSQMGKNNGQ